MPLATLEDLTDYMDISFSNIQEEAAQGVLDGLHDELELAIRRPAEIRTFTESWLILDHGQASTSTSPFYSGGGSTFAGPIPTTSSRLTPTIVYLDQSPVQSVASVTCTSPDLGTTDTLTEGGQFSVAEFGLYIYGVSVNSRITVTYDAGLDGTQIPYFKLVILRAASREVQNLHDDVVGLKDLTTRNVAPLETGFTESELRRLMRYKRQRF